MFPKLGMACRETLRAFGLNYNKALVILKCSAVFQTQFSELHSDVVAGP